jgi:hypothetical protein
LYISAKANQAKGSKGFSELLSIYRSGKDYEGLSHLEWSRLLYLSYACDATPGGDIDERSDVLPLYVMLPGHIDVCNMVSILQSSVSVSVVVRYLLPLNPRSRYYRMFQSLSTVGGKKSSKLFISFADTYAAMVHQKFKNRGVNAKEYFDFAVADGWTDQITLMYIKWLDSLNSEAYSKLMPIVTACKETNGSIENWHLETDGYVA